MHETLQKMLPRVPIGAELVVSEKGLVQKWKKVSDTEFTLVRQPCVKPYFDRIVCISMDTAEGERRRKLLEHNLKEVGWDLPRPTYFSGIDGNKVPKPSSFISGNGAWGCLLSHIRVMEDAMQAGAKSLLVMEDDVVWARNFAAQMSDFMGEVPHDWEGIFLGGQFQPRGRPYKRVRAGKFSCMVAGVERTHALAVQGQYMLDLYLHYLKANRHCDHVNGPFQHGRRIYAPIQWLAGQRDSTSQISGKTFATRFWHKTEFTNEPKVVVPLREYVGPAPSPAQIARRRKICSECPQLVDGICQACNCDAQLKTKNSLSKCPTTRWSTELGEKLKAHGSKIIHQVWVQGEAALPAEFQANRAAWTKVLPDGWLMVLWDNQMAIDQWPDFAKATGQCSHHAMRCDLILARAQRDFGGLALGTDVIPVNSAKLFSLTLLLDNFVVCNVKGNSASNGLSWFAKPHDPFITTVCKHQLRNEKLLSSRNVPKVTGPTCWFDVVKARQWELTLLSDKVAYTHLYSQIGNHNPNALVNPGYAGSWH